MNINDYDEVLEELMMFLYKRDYKDKKKNRIKLRLMFFIFKTCYDEERLKECSKILERERIIK